MRVLLVEDTDDLRRLFTRLLSRDGCDVKAAEDGGAALALVADFTPDLVLTDMMMPVMDGVELIRRLREMPEFDRVPMILITASSSVKAELEARQAGAAEVVEKPVDLRQVVDRFRRGEFEIP